MYISVSFSYRCTAVCIYLAPAGSPQALYALASALIWLPGGPGEYLLGYADKLTLPDWLTAPSAAGTSCNVPWIPSDGREHISLCFPQAHTRTNNMTSLCKPRISDGPSLRKKPQIQPEIWIKNLILNSGGSDVSRCGVWLLTIAPFIIAPVSLSLLFSLSSSLSQILDSCFTLWKGGK